MRRLWQRAELVRHFALHSTHVRALGANGAARALELFGVSMATDLCAHFS